MSCKKESVMVGWKYEPPKPPLPSSRDEIEKLVKKNLRERKRNDNTQFKDAVERSNQFEKLMKDEDAMFNMFQRRDWGAFLLTLALLIKASNGSITLYSWVLKDQFGTIIGDPYKPYDPKSPTKMRHKNVSGELTYIAVISLPGILKKKKWAVSIPVTYSKLFMGIPNLKLDTKTALSWDVLKDCVSNLNTKSIPLFYKYLSSKKEKSK